MLTPVTEELRVRLSGIVTGAEAIAGSISDLSLGV